MIEHKRLVVALAIYAGLVALYILSVGCYIGLVLGLILMEVAR